MQCGGILGCRELQFENYCFIDSVKYDNKGFSFLDDLNSKTSKKHTSFEDLKKEFSFVTPEPEKTFKKLPTCNAVALPSEGRINAPEYIEQKNRYKAIFHGAIFFREYDPIHGRWLSEDPAGYRDGLNLYNMYAGVNYVDLVGANITNSKVENGVPYVKDSRLQRNGLWGIFGDLELVGTWRKATSEELLGYFKKDAQGNWIKQSGGDTANALAQNMQTSEEAAKDIFDTFRPHPEDFIAGIKHGQQGVREGDFSKILMGTSIAIMGVIDVVDIIPDPTDVLQKQARKTIKEGGESLADGGLNLFKFNHKTSSATSGWRKGDSFLHLPNKGTPKLNWKQNAGRLREYMRKGKPIYDSYVDSAGNLIKAKPGTFLNAERKLLESRGWIYNKQLRSWIK